ncbi:hypothetical protein BGX27_006368 [Mortierella sp. AM989]|nr:hypothetical protein BGX27_006368 [Mortierella sp. AM989]
MEEITTLSSLHPQTRRDNLSRKNPATSDIEKHSSDATFIMHPFLGLGAKLSQAFASYTVVFLLFSAYRLYLTQTSVETYTTNAKQAIGNNCHSLEKSVSTLASLPHFAAQSLNHGLATALDSAVSQIGYGLETILAGFLATLDFVIGLLTGTWRCFLDNLANSEIPLLSELGSGGVETVDKMHKTILGLLALPLNDLGDIIRQRMEDPQVGQMVNVVPAMSIHKVEFCAEALDLVVLDKMRDDLQNRIMYGSCIILVVALLAILGNMAWIAFLHGRDKAHIESIIRQFNFLPETCNKTTKDEKRELPSFMGITDVELKLCALRISHLARNPLLFRVVDWSSKRLFSENRGKRSRYIWFVYYIANSQAATCLLLGLCGLIIVYSQIAVINYTREHYRPALAAVLMDISDVALHAVNGAMSTASRSFAIKTNNVLQNLEVDLNTNVFGDIIHAAEEVNASLVQVQLTLAQGIQAVFGDGAFGKMVLMILQCLFLNKLAILENGLNWIQLNARIAMPRLSEDVLMLNPAEMNKLVYDAIDEVSGSNMQGDRNPIEDVFEWYEEELRQMLPVYYGLVAPSVPCLTDPNPTCKVCLSTQTPEGIKNIKRNTSAMVRYIHEDGRQRNILIDCGKSFYESARQWFPKHNIRHIDALVITHGHADAFFGLDDLRAWCLIDKECPFSIPVYLDQKTMDIIAITFPYMVDASKATGGGDVPSFTYHIIDQDKDFDVEGVTFTPLPVHHGKYMSTGEPFWSLGFRFRDISWVSDCSHVPESTTAKIQGSRTLIMDGLKDQPHPSHFSIPQAVDYTNSLDPKPERCYIVGFCHTVDHYAEDEKLQALDGESKTTFRIAYDGQKISI